MGDTFTCLNLEEEKNGKRSKEKKDEEEEKMQNENGLVTLAYEMIFFIY